MNAGPVAVEAYSSDGKSKLADGKLDTLNNAVDASSGTIRIKALFANEDNKLWPGLSVTTRTTVAVLKNVVIVLLINWLLELLLRNGNIRPENSFTAVGCVQL